MPISVSNIDREFAPSEAAEITEVSVALQRDWRRRGLLPENKAGRWTRFSLSHIIEMAVMKDFAEAGFSVSYIAKFASIAVLPTLSRLYMLPGAIAFEGDEPSDTIKELSMRRSVSGECGRYLVMIQPPERDSPLISRFESLDRLDEFMAEQGVIKCSILDCSLLAERIAERAGFPLVRVEIEDTDKEN